MADKQNPNDPQYDWLYSGSRPGRDRHDEPAPDPDSTQYFAPPAHDDDDNNDNNSDGDNDGVGAAPTQAEPGPAQAPQSFGGVYAAPPPPGRTEQPRQPPPAPRYATPSPHQGRSPTSPPGAPPGGRAAGGPPKPAGAKKRRWWLRIVLILLGLWLVFLIAVPLWAWSRITKVDAEPDGNRPSDTAGTTYLLVGSDSRKGVDGARTDTIIMLHVPDGDGPNLLLSIPRDSYVDIPGHGMNKINSAFSFGGPQLLVRTVEKATDVRVDDYVEIGFNGFVDVVDALGGITVCPETAIDDPKANNLKLKKGCQEVDGIQALGYSRSRAFPLGDITRAEHQREVIASVGSKAASWQTFVLPWRYWKVNMAAADTLKIGENVGPIDLMRFAWAMAHTSGKDTKKCVVPYASLGQSTPAGSAVIWDEQAADAVFAAIRNDTTAEADCSPTGQ